MKDPTDIHPLAEPNKPSGKIRFIHKDGKEHYFYSVINSLTGSRMSAFDVDAPGIDDSVKYIKSVFRDIREKAKVLEVVGDF